MGSPFEIDTKGSCLLCFRSQNFRNENANDRWANINPAFKTLLEYLKIDMAQLPLVSSAYQRLNCPLQRMDLLVSLCEDCTSITNHFLELLQTQEEIRFKINLCVRQLVEFMGTGSNDVESVRQYECRMGSTGGIPDLINTAIAEELRNETKAKAFEKVASFVPKIPLNNNPDGLEGKSVVARYAGPVQLNSELKTSLLAAVENKTRKRNREPGNDDCSRRLSSFEDDNSLTPTPVNDGTPPPEEVDVETKLSRGFLPARFESKRLKGVADQNEDRQDVDQVQPEVITITDDDEIDVESFHSENDDFSLPPSSSIKSESRHSPIQINLSNSQNQYIQTPLNPDTPTTENVTLDAELNTESLPDQCELEVAIQNQFQKEDDHIQPKVIPPADATELGLSLSCHDVQDEEANNAQPLGLGSAPMTMPVRKWWRTLEDVYFQCTYCVQQFPHERNLITHHYRSHTLSVLKDKELIPQDITEQQLNTALKKILGQSTNQCPVCPKAGFRFKDEMRSHILQKHPQHIIEKLEEGRKGRPKKVEKILLRWKCGPCGKEYPSQRAFDLHRYKEHLTSILTERGLLPVPSDIAENQLIRAVDAMLTLSAYCKICKRGRLASIDELRKHLLLKHLPRLIANAGIGNEVHPLPKLGNRRSSRIPEQNARKRSRGKDFIVRKALQNRRRRQAVQTWKCVHCGRNFPNKFKLDNHQLRKHSMAALKEHLPSSISRKVMVASMRTLVDQMKRTWQSRRGGSSLKQCLWCDKNVWYSTRVARVKLHMLKCHMEHIVHVINGDKHERAHDLPKIDIDESSVENPEGFVGVVVVEQAQMPSQTKCEYCEKDFSSRNYLDVHKYTQHTFTHLSNQGILPADATEQHFNQILTHLQNPNESNALVCQICRKKGFQSTSRLRYHLILKHADKIVKAVVDLLANEEKCQPNISGQTRQGPVSGRVRKTKRCCSPDPEPSSMPSKAGLGIPKGLKHPKIRRT